MTALVLALLSLGVAGAADSPWHALYDALLAESADGNLLASSATYQRLVRNLPADHPARAKALFHLGRTRYTLGEVAEARKALLDGVRTVAARPECLALLGQIELEQSSIQALPVRWDFNDDKHGIVHPWEYADRGSIRIDLEAADPNLTWRSAVDSRHADRLVVGFRTTTRPSFLEVEVAASEPTRIQILTRDRDGKHGVAYAATTVGPAGKILKVGLAAIRELDQVLIEHMRTEGSARDIELRVDDLKVF